MDFSHYISSKKFFLFFLLYLFLYFFFFLFSSFSLPHLTISQSFSFLLPLIDVSSNWQPQQLLQLPATPPATLISPIISLFLSAPPPSKSLPSHLHPLAAACNFSSDQPPPKEGQPSSLMLSLLPTALHFYISSFYRFGY